MNSSLTKQQKHYALLFLVLLAVMAFFCTLAIILIQKRQSSATVASIYQNGSLIQTISLSSVTAPYQLKLDGPNGSVNIIEVRPGSIGIVEADCPDQICVNMGIRSHSLLPITCLPNRLIIVFSEATENTDTFDLMTY